MRNTKLIVLFSIIAVLAVIVILNSVVFAVRKVDIYCYNADDEEFKQSVLEAADIKKGQSIFFMSEKNPTERVHEKVTNAKVVNIERKFPNRVIINVVKLIPHSYIYTNGQYLIIDNGGKILDITDAEGFGQYVYMGKNLIELKLLNSPVAPLKGSLLDTGNEEEIAVYNRLLKALERIDYRTFDAIALLQYIDLTEYVSEKITLETQRSDSLRGTLMVFFGTGRLDAKVRDAVSVFLSEGDKYRTEYIITVTDSTLTKGPRG